MSPDLVLRYAKGFPAPNEKRAKSPLSVQHPIATNLPVDKEKLAAVVYPIFNFSSTLIPY